MNKVFKILFATVLLPFSSMASLGTEGVGGGGGMVCETPAGKSIELLEFWEAENLRHMSIKRVQGSPIDQARQALQRLIQGNPTMSHDHAMELQKTLDHIWRQINLGNDTFIPSGTIIAPPSDAMVNFGKKNCQLQGIAIYFDLSNVIRVDRDNYIRLSDTGKAGLLVHETIYRFLRYHFQVKNSITARGITACLFSHQNCPEISLLNGIPEEGPLFKCDAGESQFVIYSVPNPIYDVADMHTMPGYLDTIYLDLWRIQFLAVGEKPLMTKVYYGLPALIDDGISDSGGVIERTYSFPLLQARSSEMFYKNFPIFAGHDKIHLAYTIDSRTRSVLDVQGQLGNETIVCQPR